MKKAVIYCRVSSNEQVENQSLQMQEKACREYCKREGYQVDKVFIEEGESAKTTNRPQLQDLLSYCAKNKGSLDCVVVYALNRFSRNLRDHVEIQALLGKLGITLRSVTEEFNDYPSRKLMEGFLAVFAQCEYDMHSERIKRGMREAAARRRTQNANQG